MDWKIIAFEGSVFDFSSPQPSLIDVQSTIQPAGSVTFEHNNLQGLNHSILNVVTSNNLFNPNKFLTEVREREL
uniref:Uncharacterized protein n=1 Tax=Physcomitrium patens TaxID=3218 RepID=A0A2K1IVV4_PHYPA|nr:hypothetical protein PHYPA_025351 [Physcomitrium patens]